MAWNQPTDSLKSSGTFSSGSATTGKLVPGQKPSLALKSMDKMKSGTLSGITSDRGKKRGRYKTNGHS